MYFPNPAAETTEDETYTGQLEGARNIILLIINSGAALRP